MMHHEVLREIMKGKDGFTIYNEDTRRRVGLVRDIQLDPNGKMGKIVVLPCVCGDAKKRGSAGGVCGSCGCAIPTEQEKERLKKITG